MSKNDKIRGLSEDNLENVSGGKVIRGNFTMHDGTKAKAKLVGKNGETLGYFYSVSDAKAYDNFINGGTQVSEDDVARWTGN